VPVVTLLSKFCVSSKSRSLGRKGIRGLQLRRTGFRKLIQVQRGGSKCDAEMVLEARCTVRTRESETDEIETRAQIFASFSLKNRNWPDLPTQEVDATKTLRGNGREYIDS